MDCTCNCRGIKSPNTCFRWRTCFITRPYYKHFLNKSFCWVTYVEFRKSQQDEISPQAPTPHQCFHYLKNAVSSSNLQSAKQVKKIFFRCPLQASIPTRLDHMQLNTICAFYYYYNIPPPPFLKCYILTFFNFSNPGSKPHLHTSSTNWFSACCAVFVLHLCVVNYDFYAVCHLYITV